jgi:hypothetical protein
MTQNVRDFENTFAHAWTLLVRNPVIVLPGIVLGIAAAAAEEAIELVSFDAYELLGALAAFALALAFALVQMAIVTGMSGDAWRHEKTSLRHGWDALAHRVVAAAGAGLLLFVLGFCAAALAPATLGITLIAYAVFFVYTMAAVVIGERAPIAAIVESANTALKNILPTVGVIALIGVIAALAGFLGGFAARFSDVAGWLVSGLIQQVVVAYATLVVAGEYLKLTHAPTES